MRKILGAIITLAFLIIGGTSVRADGGSQNLGTVQVSVVITNFCNGNGEGYVAIRGPESLNGIIVLHAAIFTAGGIVRDIEENITADYNPNGVGVGDYGFSYVGGWEGATSVVLYAEYTAAQGVFISENTWFDFTTDCSVVTPAPPNYFDPVEGSATPPPPAYPPTTLPAGL